MALGGGTFLTQNKILPGSYINVISLTYADPTLSDRGVVAMPILLDWGIDNEVFTVTQEDFQKESLKLFGYAYTHEKLKGLRDLFKNAISTHFYKLTSNGVKASNDFATAKYTGIRGNDIRIVIENNIDDIGYFDVYTYFDSAKVDSQKVLDASELVNNDYVDFKKSATLIATAGTPLIGGTTGEVTGLDHQTALDSLETYAFNALGCLVTDATTKLLYDAFTKRMRDQVGSKFQTVIFGQAGDYEGIVNVTTPTDDEGWEGNSLVYWVTGAIAGCAVNKSNTNKKYDGEFTVVAKLSQTGLTNAIQNGEFVFHKVDKTFNVLSDINSFVTVLEEKNEYFQDNQTIRVADQIAIDIAGIFNSKFLGKIQNDDAGRISLWSMIKQHHEELQKLRAIENFASEELKVGKGNTKKSVVVTDPVQIVNTMDKMYMTVIVQ